MSGETPTAAATENRPGNYIADSLRWLGVLRWWAICGVTLALLTAWAADLISTLVGPMLVVFGLAALNILGTRSQILRDVGVGQMRLMGFPGRFNAISAYGLEVTEYVEFDADAAPEPAQLSQEATDAND